MLSFDMLVGVIACSSLYVKLSSMYNDCSDSLGFLLSLVSSTFFLLS